MSEPKFGDVFRERITKIDKDAQAAGINMTTVCKEAGVSRATPDRWRRKLPKTVEIIENMESIVALHSAEK